MSTDIICEMRGQEIVSDINSAIDKCKIDSRCKAVKDWNCSGKNVVMCKGFRNHPTSKKECTFVKGKHLIGHFYELLCLFHRKAIQFGC